MMAALFLDEMHGLVKYLHTNISAELTASIFRLVGLGIASVSHLKICDPRRHKPDYKCGDDLISKLKKKKNPNFSLWHKIPHFIPQHDTRGDTFV